MILPLYFRNGHVFVEIGRNLWLLDTGSPASFGGEGLILAGREFHPPTDYLGLTVKKLSNHVSVECAGLLGCDILNCFDVVMDLPGERIEFSSEELPTGGQTIPIEDVVEGIPIVPAAINQAEQRMFFDTGAGISYWQDIASLETFPPAGEIVDFYPGMGEFRLETYRVDVTLGPLTATCRCSALPASLQGLLQMAENVSGIIGNEIMRDRKIGYFPRRGIVAV